MRPSLNVSVITCDDIRLEATGKAMLIGVYPGDLSIPTETATTPHINFFFSVDGELATRPGEIKFQVKLPEQEAADTTVSQLAQIAPVEGRTRWSVRHGMGFANAVLRPGRILATVIVDGEEYSAAAPWVVFVPPPTPAISVSTASPPPSAQSRTSRKKKAPQP